MHVNVEDGLTGFGIAVEHRPVARAVVSLFLRNLRGGAHHGSDERVVLFAQIVEGGNVLPGHDQHVQRRLRVDVGKRQQPIVFVDFRRGNLAGDDATEQTAHCTIFRSITATRGMRCRSVLMRLSVSDGKSLNSAASASAWVWPISMNRVPPGLSRSAARSTICRMSRRPSSPASKAICGSYSRTSGASCSYSASLM